MTSLEPYADLNALKLEEDELVIFRTEQPLTRAMYESVAKSIRKAVPNWKGFVIVLGIDQSLEKLPAATVFEIYQALKMRFESTERWMASLEAERMHCVRCGQALPEDQVKSREDTVTSNESTETI